MAIILKEELDLSKCKNVVVVNKRDDLMCGEIRLAVCSLSQDEVKELVNLLNSIADQGIRDIDVDKLTYTVGETSGIRIEKMCSAEKLFVLAFLAKKGKLNVIIECNMLGLEKDTMRDFFSIVNDLDNFSVIAESEIQKIMYQEAGGLV